MPRARPAVRQQGRRAGRHSGSTCPGAGVPRAQQEVRPGLERASPTPGRPVSGPGGQRWRDVVSRCCSKGKKILNCPVGWPFSAKGPTLSVPCPLYVSGLGTCTVLLRSSSVISLPAPGRTSNAMWLLHFFFFFPGTGNTQHQLFYYYLGWGGMILLFGVFLKMKNKKLYIIYILYT